MNAALIALLTVGSFVLSYFLYSRFLSEKIFQLEDSETVPSKLHADGVDFVATKRSILWGHHFTSIAGAAPIVGPAIAVIWGWLPALIWIVLGTIFMGAVHDFSAMVISLRNQGRSIGDITGEIIGPRARTIFLLIISLLIWIKSNDTLTVKSPAFLLGLKKDDTILRINNNRISNWINFSFINCDIC